MEKLKSLQKFFRRRWKIILGVIVSFWLCAKIFPAVAGVIICLLLLAGYYGVLVRGLKFCNVNFLSTLTGDLPRIFIVSAVATIFLVLMINAQDTIYTSDSLETWEPTLICDEKTFTKPLHALKDLRWSINHDDYNNFLPMLMVLPMHIFGRSFLLYELYVWFMFALPAVFIAAATFKTVLENAGVKIFSCSALMAMILIVPTFEIPFMVGYANASILLPGAIIWAMLLSLDKKNFQREPLILIALLSVLAVFQARTAAYMILGIFTGYTLYVAVTGFHERTLLGDLLSLCQKFFFVGVAALLMMLPLFFPFVWHMLTFDVGAAYAAYSHGYSSPILFLFHAGHFGLVIYVLFLLGVAVSLRNKKLSPIAAFLLGWAIVPPILICHVQMMDRQHFYTIILPFAFALALLFVAAQAWKKSAGVALLFLLSFNFLQGWCAPLNIENALSELYKIPARKDVADVKKFVADIRTLAGTDKKVYILTSRGIYNAHTFTKLYLPDERSALPNLINIYEVDRRDGFQVKFFDADIVVVTEPVLTHLRAEDQSVVVKLSELVTSDTPIAKHFKLVDERTLQPQEDNVDTVKFKVYEKISPYTRADIDYVEKIFVELYPDEPALFKDRFEKYKQSIK